MLFAALRREFASRRARERLALFLGTVFIVSWFPGDAGAATQLGVAFALLAPVFSSLAAERDRAAGITDQLRVAGIAGVEAALTAFAVRMAWVFAAAAAISPALVRAFLHGSDPLALARALAASIAIGSLGSAAGLAVGRRLNGLIAILGSYLLLVALVYAPSLIGMQMLVEDWSAWDTIALALDMALGVAITGVMAGDARIREVQRRSTTIGESALAWGEVRRWRSPAAAIALIGSVAASAASQRFAFSTEIAALDRFSMLLALSALATLAGASFLSSERERQTLPLLSLAVDDGEIVRGKADGFLRGIWMLLPVPAAMALASGDGLGAAGWTAIWTVLAVSGGLAIGIACSRAVQRVATATLSAFALLGVALVICVAPMDDLGPAWGVFWCVASLILLFAVTESGKTRAAFDDARFEGRPKDDVHPESADVAAAVRRLHDRIDDVPAGQLALPEPSAEGAVSIATDPRGRIGVVTKRS